jgi:hypothetical protein
MNEVFNKLQERRGRRPDPTKLTSSQQNGVAVIPAELGET